MHPINESPHMRNARRPETAHIERQHALVKTRRGLDDNIHKCKTRYLFDPDTESRKKNDPFQHEMRVEGI